MCKDRAAVKGFNSSQQSRSAFYTPYRVLMLSISNALLQNKIEVERGPV